VTVRA
jgi:hypothetical protein